MPTPTRRRSSRRKMPRNSSNSLPSSNNSNRTTASTSNTDNTNSSLNITLILNTPSSIRNILHRFINLYLLNNSLNNNYRNNRLGHLNYLASSNNTPTRNRLPRMHNSRHLNTRKPGREWVLPRIPLPTFPVCKA